jgi:hypothetical protein
MTVTTTYIISFGLFIPDGGVVTEDEWNRFLTEEVCPVFTSFSVREELGFWNGEPEPIKVITIISDNDELSAVGVYAIAQTYRNLFNQEAVLVSYFDSITDLI